MLQVSSTKNLKYELNYYQHQPTSTSSLPYGEPSIQPTDSLLYDEQQPSTSLKSHRIKSDRLSRRYQPYSTTTTTTSNNNAIQDSPLFGPIPCFSSSSSSSSSSSPSLSFDSSSITSLNNSSILEDNEIFDEFDDFIQTPTYLSSPPPSPLLSPSSFTNDNDDDDFDFSDFPLFS